MKRLSRNLALALLASALASSSVFAGEKNFVLKNGRTVHGELVREDSSGYVVKTGGGTTTLPRPLVARVEDPPPPLRPFLEPDPAPVATDEPAPSRSTPGLPAPAPTTTPAAGPASAPSGAAPAAAFRPAPLATPEELSVTKKALAALPEIFGDDPSSSDRRQAAVRELMAKNGRGVVALLAEVTPAISNDQTTALACALALPDTARPLVARAIGALALDNGAPGVLFQAIDQLGDDPAGTLELALAARLKAAYVERNMTAPLAVALGKLGTRRSLPVLFAALLDPDAMTDTVLNTRIVGEILRRDASPAEAVQPLVERIDPAKLPRPGTLDAVLTLLAGTPGLPAKPLVRIMDSLDALARASQDAAVVQDAERSLGLTYLALAKAGGSEAKAALLRALDTTSGSAQRLALIESLGHFASAPDGSLDLDVAARLADRMSEPGRSTAELAALARALGALTGQSYGTNGPGWRSYVQGLQR